MQRGFNAYISKRKIRDPDPFPDIRTRLQQRGYRPDQDYPEGWRDLWGRNYHKITIISPSWSDG
jgi:hypothetical protein